MASTKPECSKDMMTYFWSGELVGLLEREITVPGRVADLFFRKKHQISFETVSMAGVSHVNPFPMISAETFGHWFLSSKTVYCYPCSIKSINFGIFSLRTRFFKQDLSRLSKDSLAVA